ncbi:hypothetical protein CSAL01_04656 [Colletotrichum salicis]|uniref:Cell wall protein n=1 Tax=Colletotrichum salicis TaxID=1209931 RepID=A0A135RWH4_9PEZI|nr:hypothetical protein CSAL01_04656 [Colletotrichum salicis]
MYTKVFTATVAVLSFASVEAAILPRAPITPGTIVLPEVVFNPGELTDPLHTALNILRGDIPQHHELGRRPHKDRRNNSKGCKEPTKNAVIRQVTSNTNSIRTRVGTVVGNLLGVVPSGLPAPSATSAAPPSVPTAEVVQIAQDVVLQAQVNAVADPVSKAAYTLAYTQANLALQIALSTVAASASTALTAVANAAGNVNGLAERIRNIQAKLNPVLVVGVTPDVTF